MNYTLKDEAIFIADSHYNTKNQELKTLLNKLETKELFASQIYLLGDNFDFLSSQISYFKKINQELIDKLNTLSFSYEIFYLEGNHDYNLQGIFPNIKCIKREEQAFILKFKNKKIAISHGDNFINWHYNLYCKIIRNSFFLSFLNLLDINFFISKKIEKILLSKDICKDIYNFETLARKRIEHYKEDIIIEGHYHQGKIYTFEKQEYINAPSLACQKSFLRFKNTKFFIEKLKD